jgi:hypothetical protein
VIRGKLKVTGDKEEYMVKRRNDTGRIRTAVQIVFLLLDSIPFVR